MPTACLPRAGARVHTSLTKTPRHLSRQHRPPVREGEGQLQPATGHQVHGLENAAVGPRSRASRPSRPTVPVYRSADCDPPSGVAQENSGPPAALAHAGPSRLFRRPPAAEPSPTGEPRTGQGWPAPAEPAQAGRDKEMPGFRGGPPPETPAFGPWCSYLPVPSAFPWACRTGG